MRSLRNKQIGPVKLSPHRLQILLKPDRRHGRQLLQARQQREKEQNRRFFAQADCGLPRAVQARSRALPPVARLRGTGV